MNQSFQPSLIQLPVIQRKVVMTTEENLQERGRFLFFSLFAVVVGMALVYTAIA